MNKSRVTYRIKYRIKQLLISTTPTWTVDEKLKYTNLFKNDH